MKRREPAILLVEDDPGDVLLMREAFKACGMPATLEVIQDGRRALDRLLNDGSELPDLVVLDLNLPGIDGREILARLKADPHAGKVPVIVLTTSDDEADVEWAYRTHANCFITKPMGLERLFAIVRRIEEFWFETARLP